ncbi:hypothetical protein DBT_1447 [Dissulfuribacter thermophilus]|uniref:Mobile element protein n=1 Tax=Dissulfuribacter thermophilus TaxID=1156395 RepID=A0A1B9F663_9BACT|nr:hypothetical protein DBT_1447 [Dissulfuribacter thermophilus]
MDEAKSGYRAISHLKHCHRMDRNRLKGILGDCLNVILSAAGMNFHKLLRWAAVFWRSIYHELLLAFRFTHSYG